MPLDPNIIGSISTNDNLNTITRSADISPEIRPLLSAVKNADANILNPANKNCKANILPA